MKRPTPDYVCFNDLYYFSTIDFTTTSYGDVLFGAMSPTIDIKTWPGRANRVFLYIPPP